MPSSMVMRRLTGLEPKQRVPAKIRLESELYDIVRVNCLSLSDLANIGMEKELMKLGYLPEVVVRVDPAILLDPEILAAIQEQRLNVSTVVNLGARMVLKEKGVNV